MPNSGIRQTVHPFLSQFLSERIVDYRGFCPFAISRRHSDEFEQAESLALPKSNSLSHPPLRAADQSSPRKCPEIDALCGRFSFGRFCSVAREGFGPSTFPLARERSFRLSYRATRKIDL